MSADTTWLQFCEYDENNNCVITDFEVNTNWLIDQIEEPLAKFLDEYTSDESIQIYEMAILSGKIINEEVTV